MTLKKNYDIIIVGAGLAGLSAAYFLREFDAVLLEERPWIGGRILTKFFKGYSYDLGAVIGYDPEKVPLNINSSKLIREDGPVAFYYRGVVYKGFDIMSCIESALKDSPKILLEIKKFKDKKISISQLSRQAFKIISSIFKVIHPGEITEYSQRVYVDAFRKYYPSHFLGGNAELISAFQKAANAKTQCMTEVSSIEQLKNKVKIKYNYKGQRGKTIFAKTVIVATTADVALRIISDISKPCYNFLSSIKYSSYYIVVFFLKRHLFKDISYMITSDLSMDLVFERKTASKEISQIIIYYGGKAFEEIKTFTNQQVTNKIINELNQICETDIRSENILYQDSYKWDIGGTNIYQEIRHEKDAIYKKASDRIILAGDYQYSIYPYGMHAAIQSGEAAGTIAQKKIKSLM